MQKWRKKVTPLVTRIWTMEEAEKMSKFRYIQILLIQFIYWNTINELISVKFWKELIETIFRMRSSLSVSFIIRYHLHMVLEVDGYICM